jgi:hypothetical protein
VRDRNGRRDRPLLAGATDGRREILRRLPRLWQGVLLHQPAQQGGAVLHLQLSGTTARPFGPLLRCQAPQRISIHWPSGGLQVQQETHLRPVHPLPHFIHMVPIPGNGQEQLAAMSAAGVGRDVQSDQAAMVGDTPARSIVSQARAAAM